ncbi:SWI/SNF related-matrix-associated actin-dependent regulator of chromatin subfamily C protein [Dioscorea alata]|uniref:SWI/SNF related-matrix-associated actin-dependent regulator of chromatin subfamily C protein n=1 Tax=Dioscorea alata TaxID=55571 RepID=A0ACB7W6L1_DIOAL|nr:SWI/SNF related-matrix-associated actin-dependent regulator of chromatin subfamily C protein [Dioscorea alata]
MAPPPHEEDDAEVSCSKLSDRELYTIPASSSWFQWDEIHETERRSIPEFFDGSSVSKNPRVYKEYRDFIISKYREEPSRRLTFTEVRKSLIGDVGALHRVFLFLDRWGLINFGAPAVEARDDGRTAVTVSSVVEEGVPAGLRIVPASAVAGGAQGSTAGGESGFRLPPLTSYTDAFADWVPGKGPVCGVCGNHCQHGQYEKTMQDGFFKCQKCSLDNGNGEGKSGDGSKTNDHMNGNGDIGTRSWTDAETLLLLEAVMKHGDDWNLIAQHVRTKNKIDCIARLVQLPFGEHILGTINGKCEIRNSSSQAANIRTIHHGTIENSQEIMSTEDKPDIQNDEEKVVEESCAAPPLKKRRKQSIIDATDSLMQKVATLSTAAGPDVAAAAADAAISALHKENPDVMNVFAADQQEATGKFASYETQNELGSELVNEGQDVEKNKAADTSEPVSEKFAATAFRVRAAVATALGAIAAHAKLLADQEEREIEHLMASIIDMQLKKIQHKMKHFEELESIMEKEYADIQQQKESILEEWITVLQESVRAGIPRWRDHAIPWSLLNSVL